MGKELVFVVGVLGLICALILVCTFAMIGALSWGIDLWGWIGLTASMGGVVVLAVLKGADLWADHG